MRRRVAILGSTGSIGTQALDVIARYPDRFEVVALAAGRNVALVRDQAQRFRPAIVTTAEDGPAGLMRVAVESGADIVLAATDGAVAFDAVFEAVRRGIDVAVANKELIVAAGELFVQTARASGAQILPVDSEHSAIFQCLVGEDPASIAAIVLTASGGPFRGYSAEQLRGVTLAQALAHPTWQMGTKNTIDSATMMNKGLEIIEASRLFSIGGERLLIAVHPQSIAHGFVVFTDGSVKGQVCAPDMRIPIGYALAYPHRLPPLRQAQGDTGGAQGDTGGAQGDTGGAQGNSSGARGKDGGAQGNRGGARGENGGAQGDSVGARGDNGGAQGDSVGAQGNASVRCHPELVEGPRHSEVVEGDVLSMLGGKPEAASLRYDFERVDPERFPCVRLAYEALARGGTAPAVLSAANEVAVSAFVEGELGFTGIAEVIESTLDEVALREATLEDIRQSDGEARTTARRRIEEMKTSWSVS